MAVPSPAMMKPVAASALGFQRSAAAPQGGLVSIASSDIVEESAAASPGLNPLSVRKGMPCVRIAKTPTMHSPKVTTIR